MYATKENLYIMGYPFRNTDKTLCILALSHRGDGDDRQDEQPDTLEKKTYEVKLTVDNKVYILVTEEHYWNNDSDVCRRYSIVLPSSFDVLYGYIEEDADAFDPDCSDWVESDEKFTCDDFQLVGDGLPPKEELEKVIPLYGGYWNLSYEKGLASVTYSLWNSGDDSMSGLRHYLGYMGFTF